MAKLCRILYAEDNRYFYRLLMGQLKPIEEVEIVWVSTVKDLLAALRKMSESDQNRFDCLLLDLNFADETTGKQESSGVDTLAKVAADYSIPTIVLTSDRSREVYRRCLELGAQEVFVKGEEPDIIAARIVDIVSNYKPSLTEKIKNGLSRVQISAKNADTFAIGYTTAAANVLVIAAISYDFIFQYRTTGHFQPADWEIAVLSLMGGATGIGRLLTQLGKTKDQQK